MKFAFGVPAWLGGLKVSLILFGLPSLFAIIVAFVLGHWLDLALGTSAAIFIAVYLLSITVLVFILAVLSRNAAKKKSGHEHLHSRTTR